MYFEHALLSSRSLSSSAHSGLSEAEQVSLVTCTLVGDGISMSLAGEVPSLSLYSRPSNKVIDRSDSPRSIGDLESASSLWRVLSLTRGSTTVTHSESDSETISVTISSDVGVCTEVLKAVNSSKKLMFKYSLRAPKQRQGNLVLKSGYWEVSTKNLYGRIEGSLLELDCDGMSSDYMFASLRPLSRDTFIDLETVCSVAADVGVELIPKDNRCTLLKEFEGHMFSLTYVVTESAENSFNWRAAELRCGESYIASPVVSELSSKILTELSERLKNRTLLLKNERFGICAAMLPELFSRVNFNRLCQYSFHRRQYLHPGLNFSPKPLPELIPFSAPAEVKILRDVFESDMPNVWLDSIMTVPESETEDAGFPLEDWISSKDVLRNKTAQREAEKVWDSMVEKSLLSTH